MLASSTLVEPAFFTAPDYVETLGPEVGELAAICGFAPDAEQQLVLDAMFGLDKRGRHVAFEVAVICCRQNMKTGLFKQAALGKIFVMERPLFVWSAHEFGTAQEAFRDLTILIESTPDLDRLVKRIYRGNGDEAIELLGGQRIKFKARTKSGGRGLSGDDVGLDEAFALQPEHMGALLPLLSTRKDPQVLYGSSAGLEHSAVLRGIRDRGRAGTSGRLVYAEWCAPEGGCHDEDCDHALSRQGCALDDVGNWQAANPQLGRRITVDYVTSERQALPPGEFARERMGWWDDPPEVGTAFTPGAWAACKDDRIDSRTRLAVSQITSKPALALDVSPDRSRASLAVAGYRDDRLKHVEIIDHDRDRPGVTLRGTAWVVARVKQVIETSGAPGVIVDPGSAAGALIPALREAGINVIEIGARDYTQACGGLYDAVENGTLRHLGQPDLDAAVNVARPKPVGDAAWKWARSDMAADITPLVASTLALFGVGDAPSVSMFFFNDLDDDDEEDE